MYKVFSYKCLNGRKKINMFWPVENKMVSWQRECTFLQFFTLSFKLGWIQKNKENHQREALTYKTTGSLITTYFGFGWLQKVSNNKVMKTSPKVPPLERNGYKVRARSLRAFPQGRCPAVPLGENKPEKLLSGKPTMLVSLQSFSLSLSLFSWCFFLFLISLQLGFQLFLCIVSLFPPYMHVLALYFTLIFFLIFNF